MANDDQTEMADAVIQAFRAVRRCGSPALQQAMSVVLLILGREIAKQIADETSKDVDGGGLQAD